MFIHTYQTDRTQPDGTTRIASVKVFYNYVAAHTAATRYGMPVEMGYDECVDIARVEIDRHAVELSDNFYPDGDPRNGALASIGGEDAIIAECLENGTHGEEEEYEPCVSQAELDNFGYYQEY